MRRSANAPKGVGAMVKEVLHKSLIFVLCLSILMSSMPLQAMGVPEPSQGQIIGDNGYIKYMLDESGGFAVLPSDMAFDRSKPLSRTLFRLDGQDYIFGADYPKMMDQPRSAPQQNEDGSAQLTWKIGDYTITQIMNIVADDMNEDSYGVYIGFEVMKVGEPVMIEARLIVDTQFGENDDQPVVIPELGGFIVYEEQFAPAPAQFIMDSALSPDEPLAYAVFSDDDARYSAPAALTFGHFCSLVENGYSFSPDSAQRFSGTENIWGYADSAIAIDYVVAEVSQSSQNIGFIYGFYREATEAVEVQDVVEDAPVTFQRSLLPSSSPESSIVLPQAGDPHDGIDFTNGDNGLLNPESHIYFGATDHSFGLLFSELSSYVYAEADERLAYLNDISQLTEDEIPLMWTAKEGVDKPILWRIMGEDKTPDTVPNDGAEPDSFDYIGDGYITLMSEYVLHGTPAEGYYDQEDGWQAELPSSDYKETEFYKYLNNTLGEDFNQAENGAIPEFAIALDRYILGSTARFVYDENEHDAELDDGLTFPRYLSGQRFYAPWGYSLGEVTKPTNAFVSWSASHDPEDGQYLLSQEAFVFDDRFLEVIEDSDDYDYDDLFWANMVGSRRFPGVPGAYGMRSSFYDGRTAYKHHFIAGMVGEYGAPQVGLASLLSFGSYMLSSTRPLTKLDPVSIVFAEEVTQDIQDASTVLDSDNVWYDDFAQYYDVDVEAAQTEKVDDYYYQVAESGKNYRLTVLGSDDGSDVGILSGLPETTAADPFVFLMEPGDTSPELVFSDLTVSTEASDDWDLSNQQTPDYTLNYKIVAERPDGSRGIVAHGSSNDLGEIAIDCSGLSVSTDYDAYVWIQKNYDIYSSAASMPQHFNLRLEQEEYTIALSAATGASFKVVNKDEPSLELQSDDVVVPGSELLIREVVIPSPEANMLVWQAMSLQNGVQVPLTLLEEEDGSGYRMTMPNADVSLHLLYYPKESIWIKTQPSSEVSFNLQQFVGLPGDEISFTVTSLNPAKYVDEVRVILPGKQAELTIDAKVGAELSFVIPAEVTSGNILLEAVTQAMPNVLVEVRLTGFADDHTLSLVDIGTYLNDGWVYNETEAKWTNDQYRLGQNINLQISSDKAYWAFDVQEVSFSGLDWNYTTRTTSLVGSYKNVLRFTAPGISRYAEAVKSPIIIELSPRQLYRSYQVGSVVPNVGVLANLEKITVYGQSLEQILGLGDDWHLLSPEEQQRTRKVILSLDAAETINYPIEETQLDVNPEGTVLTFAIDSTMREEIQEKLSGASGKVFLYVTVGKIQKKFQVETNYLLRYEPFGVLGVVTNAQNRHRILLADSEAELYRRASGDTVAFTIKGDVTYTGTASGTKVFYIRDDYAVFDDTLKYEIQNSPLTIEESSGKVTIHGRGGRVSLPGVVLGDVRSVSIVMNPGVKYENTSYLDSSNHCNVTMSWVVEQNTKTLVSSFLGFKADFTSLRFVDGKLYFGGTLDVGVLMDDLYELANIGIEKLSYTLNDSGQYVFEGVKASGRADIFGGMTLGNFIDFGINASADVDTYTGKYSFEGELNVILFSFEASVALETVHDKLVPDAISFQIQADPGVVVIPPLPVAKLKGGGGGIKGLAGTIGREFTYVPPLKIGVSATLEVLEFLSMTSTYYFGPSGIEYSGSPEIGFGKFKIAPFSKFEGELHISDEELFMRAAVELTLVENFEIIVGGGNFFIGYSFTNRQFSFSGVLYTKVQIPAFKIFGKQIGPIALMNQELGISNEGIYGKFRIIGIPIAVGYKWGASRPYVEVFSFAPSLDDDSVTLKDEEGNDIGELSIGSNVQLLSRLNGGGGTMRLKTLGEDNGEKLEITDFQMFIMTTIPKDELVIKNADMQAVELRYARNGIMGDEPYQEDELNDSEINAVLFPGGEVMNEDGNMELSVDTIMLKLPVGEYTIYGNASGQYSTDILKAESLPELVSVGITSNDDRVQVAWQATNLDAAASYVLDMTISPSASAKDGGQTTYPLARDIVITRIVDGEASGMETFNLNDFPAHLQSGDYHVWCYLKEMTGEYVPEDDGGNLGLIAMSKTHAVRASEDSFTYRNARQPQAVQDIEVRYGGNGHFSASWESVGEGVSYLLEALDEHQQPVLSEPVRLLDDTEETVLPVRYVISPEMADNGRFATLLGGLATGKDYIMRITPYVNTAENGEAFTGQSMALFGEATISNKVTLQVPRYPAFDISFEHAVQSSDAEGGVAIFSDGNYILNIATDTYCDITVAIDGVETVSESIDEGDVRRVEISQKNLPSEQVEIVATSVHGDQSYYSYLSFLDDTTPHLLIETAQGVIPANSTGNFTVQGSTKPFATVSLMASAPVTVQSDRKGAFTLAGQTDLDAMTGESLVTLSVTDAIGNYASSNLLVKQVPTYAQEIASIEPIPSSAQFMKVGETLLVGAKVTDVNGVTEEIYGNMASYALYGETNSVKLDSATGHLVAMAAGDVTITVQISDVHGAIYTTERIEISIKANPVYTVRFDKNGGDTEADPSVLSATSPNYVLQALPVPPSRSGYIFAGWNTVQDGNGDAFTESSAVLADIAVYAQWVRASGGMIIQPNSSTPGSLSDSAEQQQTILGNGVQVYITTLGDTARLLLSAKKIDELIQSATAGDIDFDLSGLSGIMAVALSKNALSALAQAGLHVTFRLANGTLSFDSNAAASIAAQAQGQDIVLRIERIALEDLSMEQRRAMKDGDVVYEIEIASRDTSIVSFDGSLRIELPYLGDTPVGMWHLDDEGALHVILCLYDKGRVSAVLNHLSLYVVGQDVSLTAAQEPGERTEGDSEERESGEDVEETEALGQAISFIDVSESDWFYEDVEYTVRHGLFVGTSEMEFSPQVPMTRAMLVTVLWRMAGSPFTSPYTAFEDVAETAWYAAAISWAAKIDIISGYGNGLFGPDDSVTREQLAAILCRYVQSVGNAFDEGKQLEFFGDDADISDWARDSVYSVYAAQIMFGKSGHLFDPKGHTTRAEVAAVLHRLVEMTKLGA